jgi:uncharacterized FAD-dependent dehydrogenase
MRYRITGLALEPAIVEDDRRLADVLARVLSVDAPEIREAVVIRHSLDARRRPARHIYSFEVDVPDAVTPRPCPPRGSSVRLVDSATNPAALRADGVFVGRTAVRTFPKEFRPVVVGAGPGGLFAALALARLGAPPLLLERGQMVVARALAVQRFWDGGVLDPESNVLFGEGGAGTFSDGKIYTRTRSPQISSVLKELVELGAPERILVDARPHIGSDRLQRILRAFRERLVGLGVEFRFGALVTGLLREGRAIIGLRLANGEELRRAPIVLAPGHSARDTFRFLKDADVPMEAWSCSIGLRIEHPQTLIDRVQYKTASPRRPHLPPADYHLAHHDRGAGRGAYTFCMCPGGRVIAATGQLGRVVTNGMADGARSGQSANSGIVVQVRPEDYRPFGPPSDPLSGLAFQDHWERRAFELGGGDYRAPAQRVEDFIASRPTTQALDSTYRPGVTPADLRDCLPKSVSTTIAQALVGFGRRLRGFDGPEAVLLGVETRASSPVRILRDDEGRALGLTGLYPVGEGAGYAGGIVSAAVDGIRSAELLVEHARVRHT